MYQLCTSLWTQLPGWGWQAMNGVITLVLGILVLAQWPVSGLWAIGLLVGIDLTFYGWAWVALALDPLVDASRRARSFPVVMTVIIVVNALVFILELGGGDAFVNQWSVVPADIVAGHRWVTIVSAMFMHAGWMHILGNMVFLWAFGPEIEDATGRLWGFICRSSRLQV